MKKAILISIRPEWVAKILTGEKTIEIRKTVPKCELPIDVYVYCTKGNCALVGFPPSKGTFIIEGGGIWVPKGSDLLKTMRLLNGAVVAKFTMKWDPLKLCRWEKDELDNELGTSTEEVVYESCVPKEELLLYVGENGAFEWLISDLEIFDEPKELSDFGLKRAPQSWQYVEVEG